MADYNYLHPVIGSTTTNKPTYSHEFLPTVGGASFTPSYSFANSLFAQEKPVFDQYLQSIQNM